MQSRGTTEGAGGFEAKIRDSGEGPCGRQLRQGGEKMETDHFRQTGCTGTPAVSCTTFPLDLHPSLSCRALGIPATECEFVGSLPVIVVGQLKVALEPRLWELGKVLQKAG